MAVNEILCVGALRACQHLFLGNIIPADFHSQILRGSLFPALILKAGEPGLGLTPKLLKRETLQLR